jgi:hypothetical protein
MMATTSFMRLPVVDDETDAPKTSANRMPDAQCPRHPARRSSIRRAGDTAPQHEFTL